MRTATHITIITVTVTVSVMLILCLQLQSVLCEESVNHGPHAPHNAEDGSHNPTYDHQAVLGSEGLEEEFDGLPPEESRARLLKLAQEHDIEKDGFISKDEMNKWMVASFLSLDREEGLDKFKDDDENGDGFITWEEYMSKTFGIAQDEVDDMRQTVVNADGHEDELKEVVSTLRMLDQDLRFFHGADLDKDGKLNPDEYVAFFFPHNYEHMHQLELERYLSENDANADGRISLKEFTPAESSDESRITAEENFADLDKDKDGYLSSAELKEWVVPGSDEIAEDEANHLFSMADANGDDKLSMEEIADKTMEFVGSSVTDYGNLLRHEEL